MSGPDTILSVFQWLGLLVLGALAILLVRAYAARGTKAKLETGPTTGTPFTRAL